jgi:hypothetical protein
MKSFSIRGGIQNGAIAFRAYLLIHAGKKVVDLSYLKLKRPGHNYFPIISPVELHHLRPTYGLRWRSVQGVMPFRSEKRAAKKRAAAENLRTHFIGSGRFDFSPDWTTKG